MFRSRLLVAVLSLSAALIPLGIAIPASANKPGQIYERSIHFTCTDVRTSDGVVEVSSEDFSEFNEVDGNIRYWAAPETPETSVDPTFNSSAFIEDQHITRDGYHFDGTLVMMDRDFNPVGNATFSVDLIPTSDVLDVGGKSKFGNRNTHDKSTVQFFSVSGSVTLQDGKVFDLTNCTGPDGSPPDKAGADVITDYRVSDPSQFVLNLDGVVVACDIQTDSYALNLSAFADKTDGSVFTQVGYFTADAAMGGEVDGVDPGITLTRDRFSGAVPLTDFNTGDPAGAAVIDVTFAQHRHSVVRGSVDNIRVTEIGYDLTPSGTITLPTTPATVVDLSQCFAFDGREQQKEHRPRA